MLRAPRGLSFLAIVAAVVLNGCTSIAPLSTATSATAPAETTAAASAPGSATVSEAPVTADPAADTPQPTRKPRPSATAGAPGQANFSVTKLSCADDPLVVGVDDTLRVTVKNTGNGDAGAFSVAIVWLQHDGETIIGQPEPFDVPDGLAAGTSSQFRQPVSIADPGSYDFIVTADFYDEVEEANEDDNSATLTADAVALPNLKWTAGADGFKVVAAPDGGQYSFQFLLDFVNGGRGDITTSFKIRLFYYTSEGTLGDLDPIVEDNPMPNGNAIGLGVTRQFPGPGSYRVYGYLDWDEQILETDEQDNEAYYDVTVP